MNTTVFTADEVRGQYRVNGPVSEQEIIAMAQILSRRRFRKGRYIERPEDARSCLQILLQDMEHECFAVIFLDNRHRILQFSQLFRGTCNAATVYPREVVKEALRHNSVAVILVHNHPSGDPEPSQADIDLTRRLKAALALIEVRTLDHLIVGSAGTVSLAETGQL